MSSCINPQYMPVVKSDWWHLVVNFLWEMGRAVLAGLVGIGSKAASVAKGAGGAGKHLSSELPLSSLAGHQWEEEDKGHARLCSGCMFSLRVISS